MPEITIEVTNVQLKELDDRNAAHNAALPVGSAPRSRQSFAAAAFAVALAAPVKVEPSAAKVAGKKGESKD